MPAPILTTKLYIPRLPPKIVVRPLLIERLNAGLRRTPGITLISASAGFGKTTMVSEWLAGCEAPAAWLSLDQGDNEPTRFLTYLVAAMQRIVPTIGEGALAALQSPQPPPAESILTSLLNEIAAVPHLFILVLDDYHAIEAQAVDQALAFVIKHLPPHMHLVIVSRADPDLPLARYRVRGQLTELRAADLRFTPVEAADFLNQVMGLNLSAGDIAALETRTEGWIAGMQLAALALQGAMTMQEQKNISSFIQSFTGSHHFVLDYLVQEVLLQQPENIQAFLLHTSILERMCGPLCDAVANDPSLSGQQTLEYLERANLFIIPLDNERYWYRYHHLFANFLRQRLMQQQAPAGASTSAGDEKAGVTQYHVRASQWFEDNNLGVEAFQHAVAARDIERADRLIQAGKLPLHLRSMVTDILDWLASLPTTALDARPALWARFAGFLLVNGQATGVEEKLQAAEAALAASASCFQQGSQPDAETCNLIGIIATARATLAVSHYDPESMMAQAYRALEYLPPENLAYRTSATWVLGIAHRFLGDRAAAARAFTEVITISQATGDIFDNILATSALGEIQETENQLYLAAEAYRRALQLAGEHPQPNTCEAYLGLARICYEWNNLDAAEQHGQQSLQLARQYDRVIDRSIISEVFLARLKLARGDVAGAAAMVAEVEQSVRQHNFVHRIPEIAAAQVLVLLRQGDLAAAAHLAQTHLLPLSQARVYLAQGDPSAALTLLSPLRQQMEAKDWQDERLKVMVLLAVALHVHGEKDKAVQLLGDALALAAPGGFIRIFVDEGAPLAQLLTEAASHGVMPDYISKLLAAFEAEKRKSEDRSDLPSAQPLIEPFSQRELKILQLIAQGLSNREIGVRLFLALDTVKGHNRKIFVKLQVQSRTEAIVRAHELGLL